MQKHTAHETSQLKQVVSAYEKDEKLGDLNEAMNVCPYAFVLEAAA